MRIPQSFLDAQAAAFQDKTITLLEIIMTQGTLGGTIVSPGAPVSEHACNAQYVNDRLTAEEYGLVIGQDIIVTATALPIEKGAFIRYAGTTFRVVEAPRHDSHVKLLAKRVSV